MSTKIFLVIGVFHLSGDAVEPYVDAIERLLNCRGDLGDVAVSGDGEGGTVVHLYEHRAYVPRDGVEIEGFWDNNSRCLTPSP